MSISVTHIWSLASLQREVETMKLCKHDNVLQLHAAFNVMEELWLVMPFMNKGSVLDIIRDRVHKTKSNGELPLTVRPRHRV